MLKTKNLFSLFFKNKTNNSNLISNNLKNKCTNQKLFIDSNNINNNNNSKSNRNFLKSTFYNFSLIEKLKLKDKIEIAEEIVDTITFNNKDGYLEEFYFLLEKENYQNFILLFQKIKLSNNNEINNTLEALNIDAINKIFSFTYNKNREILELVYEYVLDKNIVMDSLSFYYLIFSALKYKGINSAYNLFVEATLFNIPLDLSVLTSLYSHISLIEDKELREKRKKFVDDHLVKFYNKVDIE